jgi:molybdate transport system substrate-binding protein
MKTWFITGASRGFGRIWAEAALKRGDKVTATARKLEDVADLKDCFGDAVLPLALDVTNPEQVPQVVQQAYKQFGKLDVLVNNAGYSLLAAVEEASDEQIHDLTLICRQPPYGYTIRMSLRTVSTAILAITLGYVSTYRGAAQGNGVRVLASNGMKAALEELRPQCERAIGQPIMLQFSSTAALKRRIQAGEGFDVTVISAEAITSLIKEGKLVGDSRKDVAKSELGIGIQAGSTRADMRTPEGLKRTLLQAKSITYPQDGATRSDIEKMFEALGIAADVKPKIILAPSSGAATESVANGKATLVLTLFSEIVPVAGTALPGQFHDAVHFQAAQSTGASDVKAAQMLIAFLTGPEAAAIYTTKGLEPPASSNNRRIIRGIRSRLFSGSKRERHYTGC